MDKLVRHDTLKYFFSIRSYSGLLRCPIEQKNKYLVLFHTACSFQGRACRLKTSGLGSSQTHQNASCSKDAAAQKQDHSALPAVCA